MARKATNPWVRQFQVESFTEPDKRYKVSQRADGTWGCDCPRWKFKRADLPGGHCKHIVSVVSTGAFTALPVAGRATAQKRFTTPEFSIVLLEERPQETSFVPSYELVDYGDRD